ncbi:hypothetical protein [Sporosarcina limicola]|uniref:FtsH-binding integral membrane protein n=1 Tax=Sporosarcina limicola TaxID=34101 RepID=A0A927R6D1_9BACL|nr:hypothetical protein [Sporosarcina limicola]MBE1557058.1 FtsH-binding integral membrane protein [Sporosarcina limicola]
MYDPDITFLSTFIIMVVIGLIANGVLGNKGKISLGLTLLFALIFSAITTALLAG